MPTPIKIINDGPGTDVSITVWEYADKNRDSRKQVNSHLIHPGETLRIQIDKNNVLMAAEL